VSSFLTAHQHKKAIYCYNQDIDVLSILIWKKCIEITNGIRSKIRILQVGFDQSIKQTNNK